MLISRLIYLIGEKLISSAKGDSIADKKTTIATAVTSEEVVREAANLLWQWIVKTPELEFGGLQTTVTTAVLTELKGTSLSQNQLFKKLTKLTIRSNTTRVPVLQLMVNPTNKTKSFLIRLPSITEVSERLDELMSILFDLVLLPYSAGQDAITVSEDNLLADKSPKVGDKTLGVLTALRVMLKDSKTMYGGTVHKHALGMCTNMPEAIALSRMLKYYDGRYRSFGTNKEITQRELLRDIYLDLDLQNDANTSYIKEFLTDLVAMWSSIDGSVPLFTGALRARHKGMSDESLMILSGYTPYVPSVHKILTVFLNRIQLEGKNKFKVEKISKRSHKSGLSPTEFHAALKLLTPLIDLSKDKILTMATKGSPLDIHGDVCKAAYNKLHASVDKLNAAYATFTKASDKDAKATYGIFHAMRMQLIGSLERHPFKFSSGEEIENYADIPQDIRQSAQSFLKKKYITPATKEGEKSNKEPTVVPNVPVVTPRDANSMEIDPPTDGMTITDQAKLAERLNKRSLRSAKRS
jgi:hypothetical protein